MKSDLNKKLILTLKGRVSKALSDAYTLNEVERVELEAIFQNIDSLLLHKDTPIDLLKEKFQKRLQSTSKVLSKSKKRYIKEHIIPMVNKISTEDWGEE